MSGFSIRYPELSRRYSSVLVSVGYGTPPGSNRRRKSVIQKKLGSKFDNHFHVICSGRRLQSPSGKAISELQKPSLSKRVQNLSCDNELLLHESKKNSFSHQWLHIEPRFETVGWGNPRLRVVPAFFLRDSRVSETRARVKITPLDKTLYFSLSPPRVAFSRVG